MGFFSWIGGIALDVITDLILSSWIGRSRRKSTARAMGEPPDFKASHSYASGDGTCAIAIDQARRKVLLVRNEYDQASRFIYDYRQILAVEIIEDGLSVVKTSRRSQVERERAGAAPAGRAGDMPGVTKWLDKSRDKVRRIDLKLLVEDPERPVFNVNMLDDETDRGNSVHQLASRLAAEWLGHLKAIIYTIDQEDGVLPEVGLGASIADDHAKLEGLRDRGILTAEEFERQKVRLLSKDD